MVENRLTNTAQSLRAEPTQAEKRLWARLRSRQLGVAFTRQMPVANFVADFGCRSLRLVIEVDGGQHADSPRDKARTKLIEAHGYRVIRFWNNEVLENTDGVVSAIMQEITIARNEC